MNHTLPMSCLLACMAALPLAQAETTAADTPEPPAVKEFVLTKAVRRYHIEYMVRSYRASADMLEDSAYDDAIVASAKKLLEVTESIPTGELPATHRDYLRAKQERQRLSIEQIEAVMNGRGTDELDEADLPKLRQIQQEAEKTFVEIAAQYPEADRVLGEEASQAFADHLSKELQLESKVHRFMQEHPELKAGTPESGLAASMRAMADEIEKALGK